MFRLLLHHWMTPTDRARAGALARPAVSMGRPTHMAPEQCASVEPPPSWRARAIVEAVAAHLRPAPRLRRLGRLLQESNDDAGTALLVIVSCLLLLLSCCCLKRAYSCPTKPAQSQQLLTGIHEVSDPQGESSRLGHSKQKQHLLQMEPDIEQGPPAPQCGGREHTEQLLEMAGGQAEAEASSRVEAPGEHVTQEMAIGHEGEGDALAVATAAQPCAARQPLCRQDLPARLPASHFASGPAQARSAEVRRRRSWHHSARPGVQARAQWEASPRARLGRRQAAL